MGIDLVAGGRNTKTKRVAETTNIYLRLLIKLYTFLVRRTNTKFNKVVLKRLMQTHGQKRPIALSKIAKILNKRKADPKSIVCVVGTVLNDPRFLEVPKLRVCATAFSESARRRITQAGGECLSFDQLAQISPEGKGTILLRGNHNTESKKHFGTPGASGSHAKPKVRSKGKNFEKGRGRRSSSGFKVKA